MHLIYYTKNEKLLPIELLKLKSIILYHMFIDVTFAEANKWPYTYYASVRKRIDDFDRMLVCDN